VKVLQSRLYPVFATPICRPAQEHESILSDFLRHNLEGDGDETYCILATIRVNFVAEQGPAAIPSAEGAVALGCSAKPRCVVKDLPATFPAASEEYAAPEAVRVRLAAIESHDCLARRWASEAKHEHAGDFEPLESFQLFREAPGAIEQAHLRRVRAIAREGRTVALALTTGADGVER
jgi:hypothetical protein